MKIDPIQKANLLGARPVRSARAGGSLGAGSRMDEVSISDEAKAISFSQALKDVIETRGTAEKVRIADIKARVNAGTYRVSSSDIAEKLLGDSFSD